MTLRAGNAAALILFVVAVAGCDDQIANNDAEETVDPAKVGSVLRDFHGLYFNANRDFVPLNAAEEIAYHAIAEEFGRSGAFDDDAGEGEAGNGPGEPISDDPDASLRKVAKKYFEAQGEKKKMTEAQILAHLKLSYVKRCEKAGVPIFPPLPLKQPPWTKLPPIPAKTVFNTGGLEKLEIWTIKLKNGICVANVRSDDAKNAKRKPTETGIICQNRINGKACFWAARDRNNLGRTLEGAALNGKKAEDLADGDLLFNCVNCHRGDNAYIATLTTPLKDATEIPKKRYQPVPTRQGWVNDGRVKMKGDCGLCHTKPFSRPTKEWCETVLKPSLGVTMPVDNLTGKVVPRRLLPGEYARDLRKLDRLCRDAKLKGGLMLNFDPKRIAAQIKEIEEERNKQP